MHDLTLGAPVSVGIREGALHSGACNDSVFGCTHCWDAAADQGEKTTCDGCGAEAPTKITQAHDHACLYAWCVECRQDDARARSAELEDQEEWDPSDVLDCHACDGYGTVDAVKCAECGGTGNR